MRAFNPFRYVPLSNPPRVPLIVSFVALAGSPNVAFSETIIPSTGQDGWAISIIFAALLVISLLSITFLLWRQKKLNRELALHRQVVAFNQQQLFLVFENSAMGIAVSELDGRYLFTNQTYCNFVGYTADELQNMNVEDLVYPEDADQLRRNQEKLRSGELNHFTEERRFRCRDGVARWGNSTITVDELMGADRKCVISQVQDTTERNKNDEELRDQGDRLNLTVETANLGTWVLNIEEDTLFWDPRTKQIFGIGADVRKRSYYEEYDNAVHPEDRSLVNSIRSAALNGAAEYNFEYRIFWPNGEIRYLATRGTIIKNDENKPVRVIGTLMDITDLKRAEEQLERNQRRLTSLHEITSDRSLSLDDKISNVLELGATTLEMDTGVVARYENASFTVSHAVDRRVSNPLAEPPTPNHDLCVETINSTSSIVSEKINGAVTDTGTLGAIAAAVSVEGRNSGVLVFEGDPTTGIPNPNSDRAFVQLMALWIGGEIERDRTAWALSKSEARFKDIAESASDWFWEMDSSYLFSYISERGLEYYGLPEDRILGRDWYSIVDKMEFDAEHDDIERHAEDIAQRRSFVDYEYSMTAANGKRVFLQSSGRPHFDHDGAFVGYRGVTKDVSIRRRAEDEILRAKEAADLANKTKSRFLAAASHDLRQPLQAMAFFMSSLQILEKNEKKRGIIEKTQASLDALSNLLNSLLDISKLESGSVKPNIASMEFRQIFRLLDEFEPIAAVKDLNLRAVPSNLVLRSDPVLLETMVRNLLANAVKYSDSGKILFGLKRRGTNAVIEVWDTGRGISNQQLRFVFEEFYQVGNPIDSREHGLGLGLSIVQRCAALLDHQIDVRSEVGKGSVFSITVPIATGESEVQEKFEAPKLAVGPGGKILLIDDESEVLESTAFLLETLGFDVASCEFSGSNSNLDYVIQEANSVRPDIIISDYFLGEGLTGIDVVNQVRSQSPTDIPVILLTGDISTETGRKAEMNNFKLLQKPVRGDELCSLVSDMLANTNR